MILITFLQALAALCLLAAAFALFTHLERRDQGVAVVMIILWLLVADAAIYPNQNLVPTGLFHPTLGGTTFRPIDLVIPIALAARLYARGLPRQIDPTLLLWLGFLTWLVAAAVIGVYNGNAFDEVSSQAKVLLYLGLILLAADVPVERYFERNRLLHLTWGMASVAVLLLVLDSVSVDITVSVPGLPLQGFGELGSDAATIFVVIGLLALAAGLVSRSRRFLYLFPAALLLATPLASNQRAAVVGMLVSVAVLAAGLVFARQRLRITPTEAMLTALAALACAVAPLVTQVSLGNQSPKLPLQAELTEEFGNYENVLTAQGRVNQWYAARQLIAERPVFGWGLGKTFTYYEPGFREFHEFDSVHNIGGDLLVRAGGVGLLLFLLALGATAIGAIRAWRLAEADATAVFALAVLAATAGLLAKAMVDPLFEKYRLAALLGLLIGISISATSSLRQPEPRAAREDRWRDRLRSVGVAQH